MKTTPKHRTKKRFGQHFLHDTHIIQNIINAIQKQPEDTLVEIGPGQGAITFPILQKFNTLTAIELDRDLIAPLTHKASTLGQLILINDDVLNIDFAAVFPNQTLSLVGNLPYNISTPLLFHLMRYSQHIRSMTFMVQQEVAQRITASVNDKHYGRLSVMLQYYCQCDYLFAVPPECFSPPPKVDSAVITLMPFKQLPFPVKDKEAFDQLVKTAFAQRRKTIRNSLASLATKEQLEACHIDPSNRAENIPIQDFVRLSNYLYSTDTSNHNA